MTDVVFRPDAEADLTAIALHVASDNVEAARGLVKRLRERTNILRQHPTAGRPRPELGEGLRSLSERPYVLFYRLIEDAAEIVAIVHGARDLPALLSARVGRGEP